MTGPHNRLRILAFGASVPFDDEMKVIGSDPAFEVVAVAAAADFETHAAAGGYQVVLAEAGADDACVARLMARVKVKDPCVLTLLVSSNPAVLAPDLGQKIGVDGVLQIPMTVDALSDSIREIARKQTGCGRAGTILVVDDIYSMRFLLRKILEAAGYTVLEAENAAGALMMLNESRVDAVILDVMMPGMSGLQLCEKMKRNPATAAVPIVMVTARGTQDNVDEGMQAGADAYLVKPFTRQSICAKIQEAISAASTGKAANLRPGRE